MPFKALFPDLRLMPTAPFVLRQERGLGTALGGLSWDSAVQGRNETHTLRSEQLQEKLGQAVRRGNEPKEEGSLEG